MPVCLSFNPQQSTVLRVSHTKPLYVVELYDRILRTQLQHNKLPMH